MPISTTNHKGQEIVILDFGDSTEEEAIDLINQFADKVAQDKKEIKTLVRLGKIVLSNKFLAAAKQVAPKYEQYETRCAILGITGIKNILLKGYNAVRKKPLTPFNDEIAALDYLAS